MSIGARVAVVTGIVVAVACLLPVGAGAQGGPPFRAGEVVVAGTPAELPPGYSAAKYLPHANLTVVRVESGQEWGHVQRLREHGKRANLNLIAESFAAPNDPLYSPYQWHLSKIQSEAAWAVRARPYLQSQHQRPLLPPARVKRQDSLGGCTVWQ